MLIITMTMKISVRVILLILTISLCKKNPQSTDKYTIYVHCRKIYNLFVRALETGRKVSLFRRECKLILYSTTMYLYCIHSSLSKSSKTTAKLSENSWNNHRSNRFQWRHLWRQRLYCYSFFLLLYMKQVPEMLY